MYTLTFYYVYAWIPFLVITWQKLS